MLIESIIRRPGGTRVTLDDKDYHFRPDVHDRHVADVKVQAHVARFLSIVEGFRPVLNDASAASAQQQTLPPPASHAETQAQAVRTPLPVQPDGASPQGLPEQDGGGLGLAAGAPAVANPPVDDGRTALANAYKAKFGRLPHPKMSEDKIRQALVEG